MIPRCETPISNREERDIKTKESCRRHSPSCPWQATRSTWASGECDNSPRRNETSQDRERDERFGNHLRPF